MGEAIAFSFPDNMEYDVHDQQHTFDDGVDGEESDYSDASTNSEELTDPDVLLITVEVPAGEMVEGVDRVEDVGSEDASDESYECSSEEEDLYGSDSEEVLNAVLRIVFSDIFSAVSRTFNITQ
jgi:hypothetical protein